MRGYLFCVGLLMIAAPVDGGTCRRPIVSARRPARSAAVETGLTIAPFAIPVAVPVATIARPTILYGYSAYAQPPSRARVEATESSADDPQDEGSSNGAPNDNSPGLSARATRAEETALEQPLEPAARILARHCAACHEGPAPKGKLAILGSSGAIIEKLPRQLILEMTSPDERGVQRMPPGNRVKLTPAELERLRDWARPPRDAVY